MKIMEPRVANMWRMTLNEKKFIETALASDLRIDGRNPHEYRKLTIKFGREDGSSEVQLGQTHVMAFVTGQLVQPYRDRPNEGTLSIFTEFSPMADPSFEPGRPGESAVELGRIVDRGLRESRAVDTESLCVVGRKLVWAIRIDLHILDNGGNLVDAANVAALAALLTFRRPECTLGGEDGEELIVHPPEVREPLPLIVHHLPIAVTFAFFSAEGNMVVDPTLFEEAVMGGRMTVTVNAHGDICAIQKPGGEGVLQNEIIHCLRLASRNAESITKIIREAVEGYNTERALRKIKRHSTPVTVNVGVTGSDATESQEKSSELDAVGELSRHHMEKLKLVPEESRTSQSNHLDSKIESSEQVRATHRGCNAENFLGSPSSWDPYSKGVDSSFLKATLASRGKLTTSIKRREDKRGDETEQQKPSEVIEEAMSGREASEAVAPKDGEKTLKDAVKPKNKRRNKAQMKGR